MLLIRHTSEQSTARMGVKGFNTWFGKTLPQSYVPVKRQTDHLYLDMASFLHEELRKGEALAGC